MLTNYLYQIIPQPKLTKPKTKNDDHALPEQQPRANCCKPAKRHSSQSAWRQGWPPWPRRPRRPGPAPRSRLAAGTRPNTGRPVIFVWTADIIYMRIAQGKWVEYTNTTNAWLILGRQILLEAFMVYRPRNNFGTSCIIISGAMHLNLCITDVSLPFVLL